MINNFNRTATSFMLWLCDKMNIVYSNVKYIGGGSYGIVYSIGGGKVIKITNKSVGEYKKICAQTNRSPHIAHIYKFGNIKVPSRFMDKDSYVSFNMGSNKLTLRTIEVDNGYLGYVVLEELDADTAYIDLERILTAIYNSGTLYNPFIAELLSNNKRLYEPKLELFYKKIKEMHGNDADRLISLFWEMIECIKSARRVYPKFIDYHSGQFGYDRNKKLKIFDILSNNSKFRKKDVEVIAENVDSNIKKYSEYGDDFIGWVKYKLNLPKMDFMNKGYHGIVYDIGNNRVMKITNIRIEDQNRLINKNHKHICKVYQTGKITVPNRFLQERSSEIPYIKIDMGNGSRIPLSFGLMTDRKSLSYIIMEKLETKSAHDIVFVILSMLTELGYTESNLLEDKGSIIKDKFKKILYSDFYDDYSDIGKDRDFIFKTFIQLKECIVAAKSLYPNYEDLHEGQFGFDKNGILKIYDLDDGIFHWDETSNKPPKNHIK